LNYSIHKWVNWVNQCITNIYPSLCVTCTILSKCYHTLFSSVMLHCSILMWIYPHESSLNSIFTYAKHKIFIITLYLGGSFLTNHLTFPSKLSIPILQAKIHDISLSSQNNHKKFKMLNQPISIICIAWSCLSWTSVFMLCTSIAIDWKERTCLVERSERVWTPNRQVTHMLPYPFYYMH
jgi:hypothetical protein